MLKILFMLLFLGLATLMVYLGVKKGKRYIWIYSVGRCVALVLAVLLSVLLSVFVSGLLGGWIGGMLTDAGMLGGIAQLLADIPSASGLLQALIAMLLSPLLFVLFFHILRPILYRIALALTRSCVKRFHVRTMSEAKRLRAIAAEKKRRGKVRKYTELWVKQRSNVGGKICGGLCGFLLFLALMIPLAGTLTLADGALSLTSAFVKSPALHTAYELTAAASDNLGIRTVRLCGGDAAYTAMTTYEVGEHTLSLNNEMKFLSAAGRAVSNLGNEEVSNADAAEAIRHTADCFDDTSLLPTLIPDFMSAANAEWEKGRDFHGLGKLSLGDSLAGINDSLLTMLATTTYQTVKDDVHTVLDVLAVAVDGGAFRSGTTGTDLLKNTELLHSVLLEMLENEHTAPMVGDLMQYGLTTIGGQLGAKMYDETYISEAAFESLGVQSYSMVRTVAANYASDPTLFVRFLADGYRQTLRHHGYAVTEKTAEELAQKTYTEAVNDGIGRADIENMYLNTALSLEDGGTVRLYVLTAETNVESLDARVALDRLHVDTTDINTPDAEAERLATVFGRAVDMTNDISENGLKAAVCIQQIGLMLDDLRMTESFGEDNAAVLLACVLQADGICEQIGFTTDEAMELTEIMTTNIGTVNENGSENTYASMLGVLANAVHVLQLSSGGIEFAEKMNFLMKDLNPVTSDILSCLFSTDAVMQSGLGDAAADATSALFAEMFMDLTEAKMLGLDDLAYQAETNAAVDLTKLAMTMGNREEGENLFGAGGVTGLNAADFVNNMTSSEIVSDTMVDLAFGGEESVPTLDPLSQGVTLSDTDKIMLGSAMNQKWSSLSGEEKADPNTQKTFQAIGAMVGANVGFNPNTVVVY